MNVSIYESSSRGGCYEYAKYIFKYYSFDHRIEECELIVPNSSNAENGTKILLKDSVLKNKGISRCYFVLRSIINPLILFFRLAGSKKRVVIFNDFEQLTAIIWVPFMLLLKWKHTFVLFIHDSNRDKYFKFLWASVFSMKCITFFPDLILFHDFLPAKSYYKHKPERYMSVPHGLYQLMDPDNKIKTELEKDKRHKFLMLGNLRAEKNYKLVFEAIKDIENASLIIAGTPSSSSFDIDELKELANDLGIDGKIQWFIKYLTDSEFSAMLHSCDTLILYYQRGFTAQSGILNQAIQIGKGVIVSDLSNGLSNTVSRFKLGRLVDPDNLNALKIAMQDEIVDISTVDANDFIEFSSWSNQVDMVINRLKIIKK